MIVVWPQSHSLETFGEWVLIVLKLYAAVLDDVQILIVAVIGKAFVEAFAAEVSLVVSALVKILLRMEISSLKTSSAFGPPFQSRSFDLSDSPNFDLCYFVSDFASSARLNLVHESMVALMVALVVAWLVACTWVQVTESLWIPSQMEVWTESIAHCSYVQSARLFALELDDLLQFDCSSFPLDSSHWEALVTCC